MTTNRVDLTLELRSANGSSAEFYQADEERIGKTLHLLSTPRLLLTQQQLVFASDHSVSVVPVRGIDMILAHTSAQSPPVFPLIFPAGLLDIAEVGEDATDDNFHEELQVGDWLTPLVSHVEVHTQGGWMVPLKILATTGSTRHDQRQWFAHFMNLPVVAFRLQKGGIGLINPNNVIRVTAHPTPDGVPEAALPMELLRRTPSRLNTPTDLAEALHS
jgi:hypothetical protein